MAEGSSNITEIGHDTRFKKGNVLARRKGQSKKPKLRKLINDLHNLHNRKTITETDKANIYSLYEIAIIDYELNDADMSINHLYFISSDIGIKIGVSKNPQNRVKQIRDYAPDAEIMKVIKYGGKFERIIHKHLKKHNIKNKRIGIEWFLNNENVRSFCENTNCVNDLILKFGSEYSKQLMLFHQ